MQIFVHRSLVLGNINGEVPPIVGHETDPDMSFS